jgi:death-on-curing protein
MAAEALVGRIHANLIYGQFESIAQVAALYAEVIARGHVFLDGNKRTAYLSMVEFLDDNGYSIPPDPVGAGDMIVMLAEGKLDHRQFAIWLEPKLFVAPDEP